MFPHREVRIMLKEWTSFTFSELNEKDVLPDEVLELVKYAKENDLVFTPYNFMLCFNMEDPETYHGDYEMFIPDPKFNL
jgi:hypothetical protein